MRESCLPVSIYLNHGQVGRLLDNLCSWWSLGTARGEFILIQVRQLFQILHELVQLFTTVLSQERNLTINPW